MKKIIYSALAVALAFFSASCQKENLEPAVSGNTVTYTVEVPGALKTKALGDEVTAVDKVYYQVYRATEVDDLTKAFVYDGEADVNAGTASFELEFVKNQNFVVLFWAQDEDLQMFNIDDLRKVQLTNPGASNNVNAQVFAGKDTVSDCVSANGGKVELTRPISQLNIFTTKESLMFGTKSITLIESTVTVKGLYTTYNVAEGEAVTENVEAANFTYGSYAVPATEDADTYAYVAMNYVGFAPKQAATVEVDFTINTSEGNVSHNVSSVPVKPNYRTNIVGNLLTEATDYNVTLDAEWADEEYTEVVVSTASDLQTTINEAPDGEATEITLSGDIDFGDLLGTLTKAASDPASLVIPATKTIVLNLNGCTLSQTAEQTGAHSMIENNGHLTIVDTKGNGKISYSDTGNGGNYVSNTIINSGTLVIESGLIENNSSAEVAANGYPHPLDNNGELIINGGTLTNNANYASMRIWCTTDDNTSVTINGGTFNGSIDFQTPSASANKGSLTINGGTFNADTYTKCAVRLLGFGADVDEMLGDIKGGTFNGEIALRNWSGSDLNSQVFYITGGQFSVDPTAFVVDGYPVIAPEAEGGYYTIGQFVPVAMVGDQEYGSLKAAVAAVQDGETIKLVKNIEQADGVTITDKNLTIDLNDKTYTVTEGATTNNRNFKINGSSIVTIKNGTMVAAGELTSGAYGTVRTEGKAIVTLEDVKLYSYRGYGLNVKANTGTTVNINHSEIYSQYSGGVEAAGGEINLTDVKIEQRGIYSGAAWCSVAIGVNGGGKVTVNSGEYSASAISTDSNFSQGTWVAYVMSSGGTLEINGGTFNGTVAETAAAANACGLICADRAAVVNIKGGTFNSNGAILDMRNNVGSQPNPVATLAGGTFSSDPRVSGLYSSDLIKVAEGYKVVENNGVWNVIVDPAAKIGETEYASLQEAFNVGGNIILLRDVATAETVVLAEGMTVVLDLNGKTLSAADKNTLRNDGGNLTVKNGTVTRTGDSVGYSVNNASGEIAVENATIERGLYTSGSKMTATNANISHEQSSRHAIYSWNCEVTINSGTFHNDNAGNATLMASGSSVVTINGGTFSIADGRSSLGWTSSMIDQNSTAQVLVKGGLFNGGFRINSADTKLTIEGGEFNTNNGSAFTDYSGTKVVKGGKFTDAGAQNWAKKYIADGYEMNTDGEVVAK
ncbi:MAG: hypothetical protein IKW11_05610 [Bacteroidales bacterium]|nr:hypothetical protein [Bacteroidales bacterium]